MSTRREEFRPLIIATIEQHTPPEGPEGTRKLKAALLEAWQGLKLGPIKGSGYEYGIWRDEIARQCAARGIAGVSRQRKKHKLPKGRKIPKRRLRQISAAEAREWLRRRQLSLFGGESSGQQN